MNAHSKKQQGSRRRGAIAVLAGLLMVPAFVFVAFVVNLGYILEVKTEMQKAADAAALAGVSQLFSVTPASGGSYSAAETSTNIARAVSTAQTFCHANTAGGVAMTLLASDVTVGFMDTSGTFTPWASGHVYPNAVQVIVRRDATANTPLSLFFGGIVGMSTWNGQVSATAAQHYTVTGFNASGNLLLPIAVDASLWNTFLQTGKAADGLVHDSYTVTSPTSSSPAPGNVTSGKDNISEYTDTYPNKNSPGNFGLVSLGTPASSSTAYLNWIANGASSSDLAYFGSNGIQASTAQPLTMSAGPGLKSPVVGALDAIAGQTRIVPLFSSYSGNGSNMTYQIVGFAGVTVVQATGTGSNVQVTIQPTNVTDFTGTIGGSGSSQYVTTPAALAR